MNQKKRPAIATNVTEYGNGHLHRDQFPVASIEPESATMVPSEPIVLTPDAATYRCKILVSEIQQNIAKSIFALREIHDHELYKYVGYSDFREFVAVELKNILPLTTAITYLAIGKRFDSEAALKVFGGNMKQLLQFARDPEFEDAVIGESYVIRGDEKIELAIFEAEIAARYVEREKSLNDKIQTARKAKKGGDILLERKDQMIEELKEEIGELRAQLNGVVHSDKKALAESLGTERQVNGLFTLATEKVLSEFQSLGSVDVSKFAKNAKVRALITEKIQVIESGLGSLKEALGGILYQSETGKKGKD
ncbi:MULTISPECIES: hypothetical protein [Leptospira]|uniref:hypothetical protein n=1 Tax=Leptospira TaxID=171 RepID=UPI0002BD7FD7|nr:MULTISPECIES: hypothetical protein [Leptospira]EMK12912.1 hypothetical protein LEP1GSC066_1063 [Leptospira sp. serovar Kenya str. Sh9]